MSQVFALEEYRKIAEVHTKGNWVAGVVRQVFRGLGQVAPRMVGRLAYRIWFSPRRVARPEQEAKFMASADQQWELAFNGKKVAVQAWGSGPSVLLVHGWEGRGTQLYRFVTPLLEAGYRVVSFDAPGHGNSEGRSTDVDQMRQIITLLAEQEGGLEAIVAHSLGCMASAFALGQGLRVKRAVFIAGPCKIEGMVHIFRFALGLSDKATSYMKAFAERRFAHWGKAVWEVCDSDYNARGFDFPGLIIHDEDDRTVPLSQAELLADAWTDSQTLFTRGLGHRRILKDEKVIAATTKFVSGC